MLELLKDPARRLALARRARRCVEERFGYRVAARAFEQICLRTLQQHCAAGPLVAEPV